MKDEKTFTDEEIIKLIAGRIHDEYRKHPTLEWHEIAARKLYSQWKEYFDNQKESALPSDVAELASESAWDLIDGERVEHVEGFGRGYKAALQSTSNELEALKAEIKELKDRMEWISIDDRFPEHNQRILFLTIWDDIEKGVFLEKDQFDRPNMFCNGAFFKTSQATHWMPLPLPPTKNK